ncbi:hypothetical protein [Arthrobacter silvisoli]|uniref:hypothetical protein n=1 Tax=Arthrobacter silvisoli TaxID=2291022 RepID=UPI000E215C8C|nr:hypothetical protein [Arthrobacter silvisoli]
MARVDSVWGRRVLAALAFLVQFLVVFLGWLLFAGRPLDAAVNALLLVAFFAAYPWADGLLARRRFKRMLRRGHTECWIRSNDMARSSIWTDWERGFFSCRPPSVDFVRTQMYRPPGDSPFTFLVSGKADPAPGQLSPKPVPYLGRDVRSVRLHTTRGDIELAAFPEALDVLEAELFPRNDR